uniref:Uncharacterized protein n=1 Tax=Schistocephalus solidus TaxID=70667 RepID=A0A0V0JBU9_SCHSO
MLHKAVLNRVHLSGSVPRISLVRIYHFDLYFGVVACSPSNIAHSPHEGDPAHNSRGDKCSYVITLTLPLTIFLTPAVLYLNANLKPNPISLEFYVKTPVLRAVPYIMSCLGAPY